MPYLAHVGDNLPRHSDDVLFSNLIREEALRRQVSVEHRRLRNKRGIVPQLPAASKTENDRIKRPEITDHLIGQLTAAVEEEVNTATGQILGNAPVRAHDEPLKDVGSCSKLLGRQIDEVCRRLGNNAKTRACINLCPYRSQYHSRRRFKGRLDHQHAFIIRALQTHACHVHGRNRIGEQLGHQGKRSDSHCARDKVGVFGDIPDRPDVCLQPRDRLNRTGSLNSRNLLV